MSSDNGESERPHAPLELSELLHVRTNDGTSLQFEVVGILEDPEVDASYAVLWHESTDEGEGQFIVTDLAGKILDDETLAQQVLDDFLAFAEDDHDESAPEEEKS
jgi:hypothetical protein